MDSFRGLVSESVRNFRSAKRYRELREYVTAAFLYGKSIEMALRALFVKRVRRQPPREASLEYLARGAVLPEVVYVYLRSLDGDGDSTDAEMEAYGIPSIVGDGGRADAGRTTYLDGLAKRLLDYITAYS